MSKYILGEIYKGDYPTTQTYGENPQIYTMFQKPGHEGWDIGCPTGTEVVAPFDGIILRDTFNDKDYGNFTVIWDPIQHCAVWYCHLADVTTSTGDKVTKGEVVGHTNNTGHSTGPHLHVNFVETDASGNRLNMDNGKQGFLNILDPNLVEWKLSTNPVTPQPIVNSLSDDEQKALQFVKDNAGGDGLEGTVRKWKGSFDDSVKVQQQLDSANQQLNVYVNKVNDLSKELSDCQKSSTTATVDVSSTSPSTTQIPSPPVTTSTWLDRLIKAIFG